MRLRIGTVPRSVRGAKFMSAPLTYGHSGWLMLQHRALGIFFGPLNHDNFERHAFERMFYWIWQFFFLVVEFQWYAKVAGLQNQNARA